MTRFFFLQASHEHIVFYSLSFVPLGIDNIKEVIILKKGNEKEREREREREREKRKDVSRKKRKRLIEEAWRRSMKGERGYSDLTWPRNASSLILFETLFEKAALSQKDNRFGSHPSKVSRSSQTVWPKHEPRRDAFLWIFSFVVSMIVVLFILSISAVRVPKKHSLIVHEEKRSKRPLTYLLDD